jgi:hypothetical protein
MNAFRQDRIASEKPHGIAVSAFTMRSKLKTGCDFERLIGREGWRRLAPEIRARFSEKPQAGRPIRYAGTMQTVQCSAAGLLLAQLCRLIGTPFAPYRGEGIPVAISLHHAGLAGAIIWRREYRYPARATVHVQSTKLIAPGGALEECVGYGLGMRLKVFESAGELHFLSQHYFWRVLGRRIRLPHLFSPGTAHVIHRDLGDGRFRFIMSFRHRLFGSLFYQDGVFAREEESEGN